MALGDLVTRIIQKQESLKSFRTPWENLWQDCGEYVNPNRGDFSTSRYRGSAHRYEKIYDTTAPLANENLASGSNNSFIKLTTETFQMPLFIPLRDSLLSIK